MTITHKSKCNKCGKYHKEIMDNKIGFIIDERDNYKNLGEDYFKVKNTKDTFRSENFSFNISCNFYPIKHTCDFFFSRDRDKNDDYHFCKDCLKELLLILLKS